MSGAHFLYYQYDKSAKESRVVEEISLLVNYLKSNSSLPKQMSKVQYYINISVLQNVDCPQTKPFDDYTNPLALHQRFTYFFRCVASSFQHAYCVARHLEHFQTHLLLAEIPDPVCHAMISSPVYTTLSQRAPRLGTAHKPSMWSQSQRYRR